MQTLLYKKNNHGPASYRSFPVRDADDIHTALRQESARKKGRPSPGYNELEARHIHVHVDAALHCQATLSHSTDRIVHWKLSALHLQKSAGV
jgi:hypothetical protein